MRPEYLIAFYMIVCILMTFFNFIFLFSEKGKTRRLERLSAKMSKELAREIDENADFPTQEHCDRLEAALGKLSGLEAFDRVMDAMVESYEDRAERYLNGIAVVFRRLGADGRFGDALEKAYFAYIVHKWYRRDFALGSASDPLGGASNEEPPGKSSEEAGQLAAPIAEATVATKDPVAKLMLAYVFDESFYVRENAVEALANMGTAQELASGIVAVQGGADENLAFNQRVVTECLLAFRGDYHELAQALGEAARSGVPDQTAVGILNFMRISKTGDAEGILERLQDANRAIDVRIAAARYFMTNHYEPAADSLRHFAVSSDSSLWELSVACAAALSAYPGHPTIDALIVCLGSHIWYIRKNAAESLIKLKVTAEDLAPVLEGNDLYALDMLLYCLEANERGVRA